MASSGVSPSAMQPGNSGNSTRYPPPSSCPSGRISNRGSSFVIVPSCLIDQFKKPPDVHCLDRLVCRHRKGPCTWMAERDVTGSRLPPVNAPFGRLGLEIIDAPVVTRVVSHSSNQFLGFAHCVMASHMAPTERHGKNSNNNSHEVPNALQTQGLLSEARPSHIVGRYHPHRHGAYVRDCP